MASASASIRSPHARTLEDWVAGKRKVGIMGRPGYHMNRPSAES